MRVFQIEKTPSNPYRVQDNRSMPRYRSHLEDFIVHEIPSEEPLGAGSHLWLEVEKRGRTTEAVLTDLAAHAGVDPGQCGFAGRKDRHALTRQWFSVPEPGGRSLGPETWQLEGAHILRSARHVRKIRPGDLAGNRFEIVVREVGESSAIRAQERFDRLLVGGMPNRFGAQRFGRDGDNAQRGALLLRGELEIGDRRTARFLISALQSAVFNRVLENRKTPLSQLRDGDLAMVHRNGIVITIPRASPDQERADRFELSPTGPLFGEKMKKPRGEPLVEELQALETLGLPGYDRIRIPRRFRVPGTRRSLRARVEDGQMINRDDSIHLSFTLPPGSYATVLLEELFAGDLLEDAAGQSKAAGESS